MLNCVSVATTMPWIIIFLQLDQIQSMLASKDTQCPDFTLTSFLLFFSWCDRRCSWCSRDPQPSRLVHWSSCLATDIFSTLSWLGFCSSAIFWCNPLGTTLLVQPAEEAGRQEGEGQGIVFQADASSINWMSTQFLYPHLDCLMSARVYFKGENAIFWS